MELDSGFGVQQTPPPIVSEGSVPVGISISCKVEGVSSPLTQAALTVVGFVTWGPSPCGRPYHEKQYHHVVNGQLWIEVRALEALELSLLGSVELACAARESGLPAPPLAPL